MKLIVVTRPEYFVVEHLLIKELFNEGLDILHLRKPNGDASSCERLLTLLPDDCREKIVVHDNFDFKAKYKLMGIHLNSRNPEIPKGYKGQVSCVCKSFEEVKDYKRDMKYVFLSPIFNSINPEEFSPQFTHSQLRAASDKGIIDNKVMAYGGIGTDNVKKLRDLGFGGVVVYGSLATKFDAVSSTDFKEYIGYFRLLRRATE